MNELALFSGAGGGILGGKLLGWKTVCAVENNAYAASVLVQRQNDGVLAPFPIWDDVCTFDGKPWRGIVGVVSGGFPCQDISCAGSGRGIEGERSGLWGEMARIIREVRPRYVFVENSPMLTILGVGAVLGDLSKMGFDAQWGVMGAHSTGMDIKRERIWIVASTAQEFRGEFHRWPHKKQRDLGKHVTLRSQIDRFLEGLEGQGEQRKAQRESDMPPYLCKLDNGMAPELDELQAIGNGQVPAVVKLAWETLNSI